MFELYSVLNDKSDPDPCARSSIRSASHIPCKQDTGDDGSDEVQNDQIQDLEQRAKKAHTNAVNRRLRGPQGVAVGGPLQQDDQRQDPEKDHVRMGAKCEGERKAENDLWGDISQTSPELPAAGGDGGMGRAGERPAPLEAEHTAGKVSRQGGGEGEGKRGEAEEGGRDDPFTGSP